MTRTSSMRSVIRLSDRRKVVLPQPEGPMRAVMRFFSMSRLIFLRAWNFP